MARVKGNDSARKIKKALKGNGGLCCGETLRDVRCKLGLHTMSGLDFEMNIQAMNGRGEFAVCKLDLTNVVLKLAS